MNYRDETGNYRLSVDLTAKSMTLVRISPVPLELSEEVLRTVLIEYGTVQELGDQLFTEDHIYTNIGIGKKLVKMFPKDIPNIVPICGLLLTVQYQYQLITVVFV